MAYKNIQLLTTILLALLLLTTVCTQALESKNQNRFLETHTTLQKNHNDIVFDQKISFLMKLAGFSSLSASIIQGDEIIWSEAYGYYDRSEKKQATTDTIYLLASITKTVVGTALMQLYEQNLCDLDDDVNNYLPFELRNPHFPNDTITIKMLLSHTSSLNLNTQNEYYWFNFSSDPPLDFFPYPYLKEFLVPQGRYYQDDVWSQQYRPGEYAMYANVGYDLLVYLIEIISGNCFLEYCDTNIFLPLGMSNTSFNLSRLNIDQVAIPYQRYMGRYFTIDELSFFWFGKNYTPPDKYWRPRFYPAGGLYSTVDDLSRFLLAHMNQGALQNISILKPETIALMHQIQPENRIGYGLGWMHTKISPRIIASGHGGDLFGVSTWMLYNNETDIGVIYLANGNPSYGRLPRLARMLKSLFVYCLFTKQCLGQT